MTNPDASPPGQDVVKVTVREPSVEVARQLRRWRLLSILQLLALFVLIAATGTAFRAQKWIAAGVGALLIIGLTVWAAGKKVRS